MLAFYGNCLTAQQQNKGIIQTPFVSEQAKELLNKVSSKENPFLVSGISKRILDSILPGKYVWVDDITNTSKISATNIFIKSKILNLPWLRLLDVYHVAKAETDIIGYNRSLHGINTLYATQPGADGHNTVVGVKEKQPEPADLDIFKRVLASPISSNTKDLHATTVATIIGGSGNRFHDGWGVADHCSFFPSTFDRLFPDTISILRSNNVFAQNHSYGTVIQSFYGAEALAYDYQLYHNPYLLHVFSVGNQGAGKAGEGAYANIAGFANITGNFKQAKNVITVGAVDRWLNIANESSAGPVYDGRIAPHLMALGPNGTSDAAAVVSGSIALLQQIYKDSNAQAFPSAYLLKAILYNNADTLGVSALSYKTGYGLHNLRRSVLALQQKQFIVDSLFAGGEKNYTINIGSSIGKFQATLCWTDTCAQLANTRALINDLDLQMVAPNGDVYYPWVLSKYPHADSLRLPARRAIDNTNTTEVAGISLPTPGTYILKVKYAQGQTNRMPFAIAYRADTLNRLIITCPTHTNDVSIAQSPYLPITWETTIADTNQTCDIHITYNNGASWQPIVNGYKLHRLRYYWLIAANNVHAQVRITTSFGTFYSRKFYICPVTYLKVDYNCTDSFRISWQPHPVTTSYQVYTLIDSAYLKKWKVVDDTFFVAQKATTPMKVFAVEPMPANGTPATRSIAADYTLQGTQCYYNTLYYNELGGTGYQLVLQLSFPQAVQQVIFEEVSSGGQVIQRYDPVAVGNNIFCRKEIDILNKGLHFFRAKLILANGQTVYTNIIEILTSGNEAILFYPNPLPAGAALNYIVQAGVSGDSQLCFYNAQGQFVKKYKGLPNTFYFNYLPKGLLLYRLIDTNGKTIATGKLLIL